MRDKSLKKNPDISEGSKTKGRKGGMISNIVHNGGVATGAWGTCHNKMWKFEGVGKENGGREIKILKSLPSPPPNPWAELKKVGGRTKKKIIGSPLFLEK